MGPGSANIVRTDDAISGNVEARLSNLEQDAEGLAVTLWFVVFNDPSECASNPCSELDLFVPEVKADVLYESGMVVGQDGLGNFAAHRKLGDNSGSIASILGLPTNNGESWGLLYPHHAEIRYVVRAHGPGDPLELPGQIRSFGGGCVFNAPFGHLPPREPGDLRFGAGDCQDVQFAMFLPSILTTGGQAP